MRTHEWGQDAPSLHDSSILAIRRTASGIELRVELYEEEQWDEITLVFLLRGIPDESWGQVERIMAAGADLEIMKLVVAGNAVHVGIDVDPATDGIRWLDVHDEVDSVHFRAG